VSCLWGETDCGGAEKVAENTVEEDWEKRSGDGEGDCDGGRRKENGEGEERPDADLESVVVVVVVVGASIVRDGESSADQTRVQTEVDAYLHAGPGVDLSAAAESTLPV